VLYLHGLLSLIFVYCIFCHNISSWQGCSGAGRPLLMEHLSFFREGHVPHCITKIHVKTRSIIAFKPLLVWACNFFSMSLSIIVYSFYRAMHFSAFARSWDCMSSVCLSVTLMICDHIGWKSWKLIAQTISPAPSLFVAKRRSTYSRGNMGKFWGD